MEEAYEIFNYLPINKTTLSESEYLDHLWQSFTTLSESNNPYALSFSLFPFHLLFMLALQYKIMRIAKAFNDHCDLAFHLIGGRERENISSTERSVYDIALIKERTIPDLFRLIKVDAETIKQIKGLIDYRNNTLAHAKGGIETDPEKATLNYLNALKSVQDYMTKLNNEVADRWLIEMDSGESGAQYIEMHLAEEYLCPADMQQGKLSLLEERLNNKA